jgi:hypothetical protein
MGAYGGFLSVFFNLRATSGAWSNLWVEPNVGLPPEPPIGHIVGSNVNGIQPYVGFGPPITLPEFPMWHGTLTIGDADVTLTTLLQPTSFPPQIGFEVALTGIPTFPIVNQCLVTLDGSAVIHVPGPSVVVVLGFGGFAAARRRRGGRP